MSSKPVQPHSRRLSAKNSRAIQRDELCARSTVDESAMFFIKEYYCTLQDLHQSVLEASIRETRDVRCSKSEYVNSCLQQ